MDKKQSILWRLGQISGVMEGLASMAGGLVTSDMSNTLLNCVEMLSDISDEIVKCGGGTEE